MTLGVLLQAFADRSGVPVPPLEGAADTTVSSISYDSRKVRAGSVFVALRGVQADGAAFARDAISRGAVAALSESPAPADVRVAWVRVPDARLALAALAAIFNGDPSERLILVGITGTNGKTTTAYLLASVFEAAGIACGRLGTVGYRIGRKEIEAERTTPEATELQSMLRDMVAQGCGACVMEVSSHALALKRVEYLRFAAAIFTNLTRDHLDFHRNMDDYFAAKRRLFELLPDGAVAVINLDDRRGAELTLAMKRSITYAIDAAADVTPSNLKSSLDGLELDVTHAARPGPHRFAAGRPGEHLQHPRHGGRGGGARSAIESHRKRDRGAHRGPRQIPARLGPSRRRAGGGGLRPHRRRPEEPAGDRAPTGHRPDHHRVRLRRRSRSHQAAADGRGGGAVERPGRGHVRQPAIRRPGGNHRADQAGHRVARRSKRCDGSGRGRKRRAASRSSIARKRSSARCARRCPAT